MFRNYPLLSRIGILILDSLVIVLSYFLAIFVRNASLPFIKAIPKIIISLGFDALSIIAVEIGWGSHLFILVFIVIVWHGLLSYQEAYGSPSYTHGFISLKTQILIVLRTVTIGTIIVLSAAFLLKSNVPRSLIIIFAPINFILLVTERAILYQFIKSLYKKGKNLKEILVLGTGEEAKQFIKSTEKYLDWGISIKGVIDIYPGNIGQNFMGYKIIGHCGNLADVLHQNPVDELVIAISAKYLGQVEEAINICDKEGVPVSIISPFFRTIVLKAKAEVIHGLPIIKFSPVERNELEVAIKRIIDIIGSLAGLIILSPLFVVIAILIKLDSPGPVFYRWKVLGLNKKPITSYKFRTMVQNADEMKEALLARNEMKGPVFKIKDDPRITRVGKWLRKYSLDELPQLWSVLKGDLSLVGPRPPLQSEVEKFEGWHRRKLSVKPGLTCLWQISGRNEIKDFNEWVRLDMKYIDEWSLWLDIKILFKTIFVVLKGTGR